MKPIFTNKVIYIFSICGVLALSFMSMVIFTPVASYAINGGTQEVTAQALGMLNGEEDTFSGMLCSIRIMFCGKAAAFFLTVVFFTMGIMMLQGRLNPYYAILLMAAVLVFFNADRVANVITSQGGPSATTLVNTGELDFLEGHHAVYCSCIPQASIESLLDMANQDDD